MKYFFCIEKFSNIKKHSNYNKNFGWLGAKPINRTNSLKEENVGNMLFISLE